MSGPAGLPLLQGAIDDLKATGGHLKNARIHLYSNNITPARGDAVGAYTESAWAGYPATGIIAAWTASALTAGDQPAFTNSGLLSFGPNTSGSSQNVYGYYMTDSTSAVFLGGERFAGAPIVLPTAVALSFSVNVQDISQF
jgi:hypothetical protein